MKKISAILFLIVGMIWLIALASNNIEKELAVIILILGCILGDIKE